MTNIAQPRLTINPAVSQPGRIELVKYILANLYQHLRLILEAGKPLWHILPVPLDKLLDDDFLQPSEPTEKKKYTLLFSDDEPEVQKASETLNFTDDAAAFLNEHLTRISLPGLSNFEQMELLALVDTVLQGEHQKRSLDENGLRYLLFMRRHNYLNRALPPTLRMTGLSYRDVVWALHSESQELLLEYSTNASGGRLYWKDAKALGIFLWFGR